MSNNSERNTRRGEVPEMPPALRNWANEQPPEERRKLERSWELAGQAESLPVGSETAGTTWKSVADALRDDPGRQPLEAARRAPDRAPTRPAATSATNWKRRAAASLLVAALLIGVGLWFWMRPVAVEVPAGATETVALPDGSRVVLNSASSLTYRRDLPLLGWDRRVRIDGEAFFEVASGEEAFVVTTFNARAEVLGTRFNVRARRKGEIPATTVTLAAGALRLFGEEGARQPVTLAPGQQSRVSGGGGVPAVPEPADLSVALAWRTGGLAFPSASLGTIFSELERRFAVEIQASPALRHDSLSLYLPEVSGAAAALEDLCAVQGCRYRRTSSSHFTIESASP